MLQQMRKAQSWMIKGVLWAVVLAFVVTIFYSWGVRSSAGPAHSEVATILGEPVGIQEFQRMQNALYQTYRNIFRNRPNVDLREQFNFREMALEQIARQRLLLRLAQDNALVVTDTELYEHIAAMPAFQEQGRFDTTHYRAVLRSQVPPIPVQRFEQEQRQALLLQKVRELIRTAVQITDTEAEQAYRQEHERAAVRYAVLVPSLFESQAEVTEEAIATHYETHKDAYREPEQRAIRYVVVRPERFQVTGDLSPDELTDYYASHQEAFRRQEQVQVRHILFKIPQGASKEAETEIQSKAQAVLTALRNGGDFAAMAQEHSDDTATKEKGGDLGFFSRGQMVPAFEEAAFTLPVGQLSELIRTPFGYHILRVEDKIKAEVKPFVEVRQEVVTKIQEQKTRDAALNLVDDLMVMLEEKPDQFAVLATQHDLPVVTTPLVAADGRLPDLETAPEVVQRAFALVGQAVDTLEGPDGRHYIFQVAEVQASSVPELEAVKDRVRADVRGERSAELARQTADAWVAKVQMGTPLAELAAPLQVQVVETAPFTRKDSVPQLGYNATFSQVAFGLQVNEVAAAHENARHFVIQMMAREPADMSAYDTEKVTYREQQLRRKQQLALVAFENSLGEQYRQLRQEGDIVVNSQYVF